VKVSIQSGLKTLRPENLKLVQKRLGNTLELIGIGNDFLNRTQMAQQVRERIEKWDYMKFKSFYTTKEKVTKLKSLPTEWENIFASYKSDKGLLTRIYRELKKLNSPQINDPMKKWANELFQRKKSKWSKSHEELLTIPGHKRNANQNHIKIPCQSC
jgi:hypothetical protein